MLAATNGHNAVVRVLIEHGAQVDSTDKNLCTALHRTVSTSGPIRALSGLHLEIHTRGQINKKIKKGGANLLCFVLQV